MAAKNEKKVSRRKNGGTEEGRILIHIEEDGEGLNAGLMIIICSDYFNLERPQLLSSKLFNYFVQNTLKVFFLMRTFLLPMATYIVL